MVRHRKQIICYPAKKNLSQEQHKNGKNMETPILIRIA